MSRHVAFVTGGAGEIGFACAQAMARRGARIVLADVNEEKAKALSERLSADGPAAIGVELDVADREACREVCARVSRDFGRISILLNGAGVAGAGARLGDPDSAAQWDHSIQVNLTGMYNASVAALDDIKAARGVVINICSVVAFTSGFAQAGYTASKGGVRSLTQTMCRELAPFGIRVNAIAPGYIATAMLASANIAAVNEWLDFHCPMKRCGTADEVGKVAAFLASEDASYINGTTIVVDGGYLAI